MRVMLPIFFQKSIALYFFAFISILYQLSLVGPASLLAEDMERDVLVKRTMVTRGVQLLKEHVSCCCRLLSVLHLATLRGLYLLQDAHVPFSGTVDLLLLRIRACPKP